MIRPLRRCHRWMVPALFLVLIVAAVLALTHPAPLTRVDALPIVADVSEAAPAR
jgi:hypothetical protein